MMSSPILITSDPPCLKICFSKSGSSAGSSTSPMFSSITARPNLTPLASVRRKSLSLSLIRSSPESFSVFLIHLLACPWGSMKSGQRRALETMMPFSVDTMSLGRPAICHARTLTGSDSTLVMLTWGVCGMLISSMNFDHTALRSRRNSGVKTPEYATEPLATTTSPTTLCKSTVRDSIVASQRVFSPPSPPISLPARSSCASHRSTCAARSCFFLLASSKELCRLANLSSTFLSVAFASANSPMVTAREACASASLARLGATPTDTR
mmetsp:Transcript_47092/g.87775  ORF Transcript_47092/g.87775 Transcript_47092/m.87775 type:complete len:268 (-) Transcript_47092:1348-2151(-)